MQQHKLLLTISALITMMTFVSCSEDITPYSNSPSSLQPLNLNGQINQENVTRANDYGFASGDRMGIYVVDRVNGEPGTLGASDNRAANVLYTLDGESYRWSSPTTIYWRDQQTPIDIYGYYPGVNYISEPTAYIFSVQLDQSTEAHDGDLAGYEKSDLLWGKVANVSYTQEQIVVKFHHILAGVRVQLQKGDGITDTEWDKLEKIVLINNTVTKSSVDLSSGSVSLSGESANIIRMLPQSDDSYRAVVIPQTVAAGKQLLSITLDGQTYDYTRETAMDYQSGKLHNFTMTISKREASGDYEIIVTDDGIIPWMNDETSHQFSSMQYVIVHCPEMGKLMQSIAAAGLDYKTIQNLKVTGEITTEDLQLINNDMPELRHLNLYDVRIKHICYYDGWLDHYSHDYDLFMDDYLCDLDRNIGIRSLVLPKTLKRIGGLTHTGLMYSTLEIPEGVTHIDGGAFAYNEYNQVTLILPSTIDSIGSSSLQYCSWKCELNLSDNITCIEGCWSPVGGAPNFYGTFHVPQKLRGEIPEGCFMFGSNGSFTGQIEIPQGVTRIGQRSFNVALRDWQNLTLPAGIKSIGNAAFMGLRFNNIHFNDDLEVIEGSAFEDCPLPFQMMLPHDLVQIGMAAFRGCGIEGELIIPENCLDIASAAFTRNDITKLQLPSRLEIINSESFGELGMLTSLTIPKYVNYIGDRAFYGDGALQTIICLNPEPPTLGNDVFGVYFDKVILEVPEQSVELYRHTDGWKDFKNITAYHELAFNIPEIICLDKGTIRQGIIRAESDWEVSECPSWVTVTPMSGTYKEELTVTVSSTTENREGRIVFRLKNKNYTTYTDVRQVFSEDYREDATVTLQTASADGTAVPIFIVGEGYGADDIASGKYLADMQEQMNHLFSTEPYKTYRNYFTVSTAYACSPESGMGGLSRFTPENMWEDANNKVWQYAQQHGTAINDNAAILVLCNTPAYGNQTYLWDNGLSFSWIGKTQDSYPYDQRGDVLHYLGGRGFGKLGPEYVNHFTFMKACTCPGCDMTNEYNWARGKGWWQNVSITAKMSELPWYQFIFHEKYAPYVDVYEGALNHARSTYRSENQSVMGAGHIYYYNTISRYEIVRRIMQAAGKSLTFEQFVANDKIEIPE